MNYLNSEIHLLERALKKKDKLFRSEEIMLKVIKLYEYPVAKANSAFSH
jgi:hypothetical protein